MPLVLQVFIDWGIRSAYVHTGVTEVVAGFEMPASYPDSAFR